MKGEPRLLDSSRVEEEEGGEEEEAGLRAPKQKEVLALCCQWSSERSHGAAPPVQTNPPAEEASPVQPSICWQQRGWRAADALPPLEATVSVTDEDVLWAHHRRRLHWEDPRTVTCSPERRSCSRSRSRRHARLRLQVPGEAEAALPVSALQ